MQAQIPHIKSLGHVKFPAPIVGELGRLVGPHDMGENGNAHLRVYG